jgi:hypothetical protein
MTEQNITPKCQPVFMQLVKGISEKKSAEYSRFYRLYKTKILEKYKSLVNDFEKYSLVFSKDVKINDHLDDHIYFNNLSSEEKEMIFDKLADDLSKIMWIRKYNLGGGKIILTFKLCEYNSACKEKVLKVRKQILGKRMREEDAEDESE